MSIRLRLTLLYTTILALTLMVFSTVLYAAQAQYTLNIVKNDLAGHAKQFTLNLAHAQRAFGGDDPTLWLAARDSPRNEREFEALQRLTKNQRRHDIIQMLDTAGQPLDIPLNAEFQDLPLSAPGYVHLQTHPVWTEIVQTADGRIYIHNHVVKSGHEIIGIIQIARSLADRDRSLNSLRTTLFLASALTILITFGVGWTLSGVTLRPIQRITATARTIGEERDFSSRVHHHRPDDELGQLARTFNEMLSQLQAAYQRVAHALQVQRDFVADVSHELRTPLTTIRGNLALLQRHPPLPPAEQQDILVDLTAESERLSRLVTDLLQLARMDAARADAARTDIGGKLELAPVAITPLIEQTCRQAQLLTPNRALTWQGTPSFTAHANADALKQILLILLDNAIKHTRSPIAITCNADAQHVHIRVQDNGPGMSPELQTRSFDRFYRGDTSRSTPGFGLGLSIARALSAAQHGAITIESTIGKGSTFVITLPRA